MKRITIALVALLLLCGACYVSAAAGYLIGGPQYSTRFASSDAAYTVVTLETLRKGDNESAIGMLETQLDSQIVEHSLFDPGIAFWLDLAARRRHTSDKLMTRVASYRDAHPSKSSPDIRDHVEAHLAGFRP